MIHDLVDIGDNVSALFAAIMTRSPEIVRLLLDHGADVKQRADLNEYRGSSAVLREASPLHAAVAANHYELVELMIRQGIVC